MSQGKNAEDEIIQDTQPLSIMRDLDITTDDIPDIQTTTFAVDDPDPCNESSDEIEAGSSDNGEADGQKDSEDVGEDESVNNSGHKAMEEASTDTNDDKIDFQYDSNADRGDESSRDFVMGEASCQVSISVLTRCMDSGKSAIPLPRHHVRLFLIERKDSNNH